MDYGSFDNLTDDEKREIDELIGSDPVPWRPLPGPQAMAYDSDADVIGFGGSAGGGKTSLACGKAITQHRCVGIFRRNGSELTGVLDELCRIYMPRDSYNGKDKIWRIKRYDGVSLQVELGSFPNPGDERKYQGRPHDLLVFDEAANMREEQVMFLMGWLRTTIPGQRCQVVMTFNPPTHSEGQWVTRYFAAWVDKKHPNPARPGELRWYAEYDGHENPVKNGDDIIHNGEIIHPTSRTFIPSTLQDNPYLTGTNYMATLQALSEPLRSQMLYGDFSAGIEDDPWQVIPTGWIDIAQSRWERPDKLPPMDSIGCDVARGGKDQTIIARRHGMWFDEPLVYPGKTTPDGPAVAGLCISSARDHAVIHIDVIGVGASPYDFLRDAGQQVVGVNVSEVARGLDKSGSLKFKNLRSELVWRMGESLDPKNNTGIALPKSNDLKADLCAYTWKLSGSTIYVHSREEIIARIHRSPDYASAYILALIDTPKISDIRAVGRAKGLNDYDPYA